jgi:dolichol-phosphate mannosyltransferase
MKTRGTGRFLVIIPTYDERGNLGSLVPRILRQDRRLDVLVVDDHSPDGTAQAAKALGLRNQGRVFVLERSAKLGLGSAYVEGFRWGLARGYRLLLQMDADGSHDPESLPELCRESSRWDLVVGSRYVGGQVRVVHWPLRRLILSLAANAYARLASGLPLADCTSGFKCFRREVLEDLGLEGLRSDGYAFQVETSTKAFRRGWRVGEVPITFVDRRSGLSKMGPKVLREAVWRVWTFRRFRKEQR